MEFSKRYADPVAKETENLRGIYEYIAFGHFKK